MVNITLIPLTKEETKEFELKSIPLQNIVLPNYDKWSKEEAMAWLIKDDSAPETAMGLFKYWVINWYSIHNFSPNNPITYQDEVISKILGIKPQYHVIYNNYRTTVWGFKIEGYDTKIAIYNSHRGTAIYTEPSISEECIKLLLRFLTGKAK